MTDRVGRANGMVGTSTRRAALQRLGAGAAVAAVAAAGLGGRAAAQDATPMAEDDSMEGLYSVVRARKLKADAVYDDIVKSAKEGFLPIIEATPGFTGYFIFYNADTRDWTAVSIFADKAGADASTQAAADYVTANLADAFEGDPFVVDGEIIVASDEGEDDDEDDDDDDEDDDEEDAA